MWINSIRLLNKQIELMDVNKHYKTINMYYFKEIKDDYISIVNEEEYFNNKIKNNSFFALEDEFFCYNYSKPKDEFRFRNVAFSSYIMRLVHYSITLYFLELSKDLKQFVCRNNRINSYYGANLILDNNGSINLKNNNIFYRSIYKDFKKKIKKEINVNTENKVVIKLDMENFYDNVDLFKLMSFLDKKIKMSIKEELNFNYETQKNIIKFYDFFTASGKGVPQCDNDVSSAYISNLFLTFFDLDTDDILKKYSDIINHKIIRYVDDIYIILELKNDNVNLNTIKEMKRQIVDLAYNKYALRLNQKSGIYQLNSLDDLESLRKSLKAVSLSYVELEDENPNAVVEEVLEALEEIKQQDVLVSEDFQLVEIIKKIYDSTVSSLLSKRENIDRLVTIFNGFDFNHISKTIPEISSLISLNDKISEDFISYVQKAKNIDNHMIYFILEFLCKTNLKNKNKFKGLSKRLDKLLEFKRFNLNESGYHGLSNLQYDKLINKVNIINQISNRRICEKKCKWTEALNYLTNEFKTVCHMCYCNKNGSMTTEEKFKASNINEFLISENIPNNITISIINMFDRRNNNGISHTVGKEVSQKEYYDFKYSVSRCIKELVG